ncbi:hypothetical protein B0H11DRAFT_1201300 [Mycena galericulata]|nr:hypothetical protein B0H11DRAFT_1201300 [Mycena galericulata]
MVAQTIGWTRISTLNPEKLTGEDIVDLDRTRSLHIYFEGIYPDVLLWYRPAYVPFPSKGLAFLYYHSLPGLGPLSSSLRLRCVSAPTLEAFRSGRDLSLPNGLPWRILAGQMAVYDIYEGLRKKLIRDKLWTKDDHAEIFRIFQARRILYPERTLFSLQQPFPLTLNERLALTIAGKGAQRDFALKVLSTGDKVDPWQFSGHTIAHFERSSGDKPAVCIRILRVYSPIRWLIDQDAGPYCEPAAGELLGMVDNESGEIRPWTYPLTNNANSKALRLLMD